MEQNKKLRLFISYSHQDNFDENPYIEQFKKHIAPLTVVPNTPTSEYIYTL